MRWSQSVKFNIAHDRRKTDAYDIYASNDTAINFGSGSILLSDISLAIDFVKSCTDTLFETSDTVI